MALTAHCIVKNEEVFVGPAIRSVIDFVDHVLVFDTGSTDATVKIIEELAAKYPSKIQFEKKGPCDKKRHTELRQEMIEKTKTNWFMILDGDEVWTKRGLEEVTQLIKNYYEIECVVAPFYLCVGDVYHYYNKGGDIKILGKKGYHYPRFIKLVRGVHWKGDYNEDTLIDAEGKVFFNAKNTRFSVNGYWHMTHLKRSSADDNDYSSGGTRKEKRVPTYFLVGKKITEPVPEVLAEEVSMSWINSFIQFTIWITKKLTKSFGK